MTTESLADRFFPAPTPAPADKAPNPEVQAVRAADGVARQLYPDTGAFGGKLDGTGSPLRPLAAALNPGVAPDVLAQRTASLASALVDVGANRSFVADLAVLAGSLVATPLTPAQIADFKAQSLIALQERFGADTDMRLKDAMKLAKRDPRLSQVLEKTGLGHHPRVVLEFAEMARTARAAGRLK